ncbi:MAG: hypothetical protein HRF52_03975 [Ignavibacterium sp.]|jgi:hypothetical protein|uniref:hypothetical protein n=1 Tax=Ignavibacterium sp. TaxID=2651167 RepID=UPI0025C6A1DA|nr:hypothetical protein [Ignavibacterium sp.]
MEKNLTKEIPLQYLLQLRKITVEAVAERGIDVQQYKQEVAPLIQVMKNHLKNYRGKLIHQKA